MRRWEIKKQHPLRGAVVVVHHRSWSYLQQWLGPNEVATLEPKPGRARQRRASGGGTATADAQPARMIIRGLSGWLP